jgi:hypothetical protein
VSLDTPYEVLEQVIPKVILAFHSTRTWVRYRTLQQLMLHLNPCVEEWKANRLAMGLTPRPPARQQFADTARPEPQPEKSAADALPPEENLTNRAIFDLASQEFRARGKRLTHAMLTEEAGYEADARVKSNTEVKAWLKDKPRSPEAGRNIKRALNELRQGLRPKASDLS